MEFGNVFQKLDKTWKSLADLGSYPTCMLIAYKNDVPTSVTQVLSVCRELQHSVLDSLAGGLGIAESI